MKKNLREKLKKLKKQKNKKMICKNCGCDLEKRYIDDESSKKYAYSISECSNCGKILHVLKMRKELKQGDNKEK